MGLHNNRKAFSMLTAIFIIVLMSAVGAMVMNLSGKMIKSTTTQYQREQAMLLAKSYTEYAIMAVMSNDRSAAGACLNTINSNNVIAPFNNGGYNVQVNIAYIGNNGTNPAGSPDTLMLCGGANAFAGVVNTAESPLNIIVDVYVTYQDLDNINNQTVSYHKRSLIKI